MHPVRISWAGPGNTGLCTAEFRRRYLDELEDRDHADALAHLDTLAHQGRLALLTATKDLAFSHARVLAERLGGD
jgi:uncharacterized protein YeaO (DUF488 family)